MSLILVSISFVIGYCLIVMEHPLKIHKAASALLCAVLCWTLYTLFSDISVEKVTEQLYECISESLGIVLFLLGAMSIVEVIDAHNGFKVITDSIQSDKKIRTLCIISVFTFFLSAILDNLTTSIVMLSIILKLPLSKYEKRLFLATVIIAANAGGAWSPMGDVTTTMLWIAEKISAVQIIKGLFLPSVFCLLIPLVIVVRLIKKNEKNPILEKDETVESINLAAMKKVKKVRDEDFKLELTMLILGVSLLIAVPIFKAITHLPPFVGMIGSMSILWIVTEVIHRKNGKNLRMESLLSKVDLSSVLFFLGILLCVGSLQAIGVLNVCAEFLVEKAGNLDIIAILIGALSSIVDNVPVVAVAMGMFSDLPMDHKFWEFVAFTAGTGGSMLVIGSAAGIAIMNPAKLDFFWYLKHISLLALLGYLGGAGVYLLQYFILH